MFLTIRVALILLIALIAGACGAAATPTAAPTPAVTPEPSEAIASPEPELTFALLDACVILPQRDAEAIAQTPLETGEPGNPLSPSCMYTGPVTGPLAQVSIYIGDGAKKTYDIDVALHHEFTPVADIGDEAYQESNGFFFRKGTTWVAIELVRLNDPSENVQLLQDAARKVAAALP